MSSHIASASEETAECRGCRMKLRGKPYYMGGRAYHPVTGAECKINYYGGFVCSRECDFRSSLELEQDMPGHGSGQTRLGTYAAQSLRHNWPEAI